MTETKQDLEGKVAVVTGAGRGIGAAIAKELCAAGARIAVVSRTEANSKKVSHEINQGCEDCSRPYAVDVADAGAVKEAAEAITKEFGSLDILVNNAGITRDGLMMRMSEEDWTQVLQTNLTGAFYWCQAAQRSMMKARWGRIVNISSVVGLTGNFGQCNYAASKAGLIGLTKSLAREVAARNITVNAIAPGFITTDMTNELKDEIADAVRQKIPLGTFGEPEDVARAAAFLCGTGGRYITGQVLSVDGGMVM
jgi:3-oxoacyl-[acyl-carrier protein] reductase